MNSMKQKSSFKDTVVEFAVMIAAAVGVFVLGYLVITTLFRHMDNDTYWIIATGREILKQKNLPAYNPVTIHENLPFVVHQWLYTVIITLLYDKVGEWSLVILQSALVTLTCFLVFEYGGEFTKSKNRRLLTSALFMIPVSVFFACRPQSVTIPVVLFMLICWTKSKNNKKWLIPIPFLSLLTVNIHTSLWVMFPVMSLPFVLPEQLPFDVKPKTYIKSWLTDKRYQILTMFISILCGFLNPYGLTGMLYPLLSYNTVSSGTIQELEAPAINTPLGIIVILEIILFVQCVVKVYRNKTIKDTPNFNHLCLFAGCLFLAVEHGRNGWISAMGAVPFFIDWLNDLPLYRFKKKAVKEAKIFFLIFGVFFVLSVFATPDYFSKEQISHPVDIMDYIDANHDNNTVIYAGFNLGGYVEFRGYKTYIDARPEIYSKCINGRKDIYAEWLDVRHGRINYIEWSNRYGFTYFIVDSVEEPLLMYLKYSGRYTQVMEENGIYLFAREATSATQ